MNVIVIDFLSLFVLYPFSLCLSQFPSPFSAVQTGGYKPPPCSPAPLPSAYSSSGCGPSMSSTYYSPSPHRPSLLPTPHVPLPLIPPLGTPQTPLSTPQHVPNVALSIPLLAMSPAVPQQQGDPPTSQPNLCSFHTSHSLPLSQVQPTPYPTPHPEHELTEQPVQVNI